MKIKMFVFVIFFIILLLVVYGFFPVRDAFQQIFTMLVFFVVIPLIFNKTVLKKTPEDIGLQFGEWEKGLKWGGISFVIAVFVFFVAIYFFHFLRYYAIPASIVGNYQTFLFHEFTIVLFLVLVFNFFFQGFVMFNLESKMSFWAVVAQALIFWVLVWTIGSPLSTLIPYIILAPFIGFIAYKSRSIFYSSATQFLLLIVLDAVVVRFVK